MVHLFCNEGEYHAVVRCDFVFEAKTQKTALCNPIDAAAGLVEGQLQVQYLFVKLCGLYQIPGRQKSYDGNKRHLRFAVA